MENKVKGSNKMFDKVFEIISTTISVIRMISYVIELLNKYKTKKEHQKSNRSDQG